LALVGLVAEAGVVEAQTIVAAALGCPGGGRAAAASRRVGGPVAAGCLAAPGRRGPALLSVPEGGVLPRACRGRGDGGGGGLLGGLGRPKLVAAANHVLRCGKGLGVDLGTDVARQLADEEGDLRVVQGLGPQGEEVVPEHRRPGLAAAHRVV
ncbi:MAG: hypothetical protein ACK55I_02575, partial [bacterium]